MLKFAVCICLLAGFAVAQNEIQPPDPSKYLYTIFRNKVPVCIGTAVEDDSAKITIATAAHCVYRVEGAALAVSQGTKIPDQTEIGLVHKVHVHPYYMPPLVDYDIALLKVKKASKDVPENVTFVEITKEEPNPQSGDIFTINWDWKAETSPNATQAAVEDRKSCRAKLASHVTVSSKVLCVNLQSAAVPDGSPLLFNNKIVGIASYGLKGNLPKIFTNIANSEIFSFIEFIKT